MPKSTDSIFKGNFVLVFFASLLMFTAFYIMLPTLPVFLTRELKIDEKQTGIILAVYTLAALLIRPFTGFMIDRYGRKMFYIFSNDGTHQGICSEHEPKNCTYTTHYESLIIKYDRPFLSLQKKEHLDNMINRQLLNFTC